MRSTLIAATAAIVLLSTSPVFGQDAEVRGGVLLLDDGEPAEPRRVALEALFGGERSVVRQGPPLGRDVGARDGAARRRAAHAGALAAVWLTDSTVRVVLPRDPGTAHATLRPDAGPEIFARLAAALLDQFLRSTDREPVRIIGVQGFLDELGHPETHLQGVEEFRGERSEPAPILDTELPYARPTASEPPPLAEAMGEDAPGAAPAATASSSGFQHASDTGFLGVGVLGALSGSPSGAAYGGLGFRGRAGYLIGSHVRIGAVVNLAGLVADASLAPYFSTCAEASAMWPIDDFGLSAGLSGCIGAGLMPEYEARTEAAFGSGSVVLAFSAGLARRASVWAVLELGFAGGGQVQDAQFLGTAALELRLE